MAIRVLVPRLGESVEEVNISRWLKNEGDLVNEMEPLLEINTDKVDSEIPAPAAGRVTQILIPQGASARVGDVLALIESEELPVPPAPKRRESGFISPVVARMAAQHNLDLSQIPGTGLNGRITKEDVLLFMQQTPGPGPAQAEPTSAPSLLVENLASDFTSQPLSEMRRLVARNMLESKRTSPHVLTVMEADLSHIEQHRARQRESFARQGVRLTYTAYFVQSVVNGLKKHPLINSSWGENELRLHQHVHLALAVSLGSDGLIVPVIKNAENLSLLGTARAINDLADRARSRKLLPDEVHGGTFTLTNHGTSGSLFAMPIINQPQCGILGIGAVQKRVVVVTDELGRDSIAIRPMIYLSFVFDHRILDGAAADGFLMDVKKSLETWEE